MSNSSSPEASSPSRERITIGDKVYIWYTNFGLMTSYYRGNGSSPNRLKREENNEKRFFVLAQKGVGVIPEQRPVDCNGNAVPGFAFYVREELVDGEVMEIGDYLRDKYPQAFGITVVENVESIELSLQEVSILVDEAMDATGLAKKLAELDVA